MSHFAKIDKDGVVENVIVAEQDFVDTLDGTWIQTSYNTVLGKHTNGGTPLRWKYANVGDVYNSEMDEFHIASPFPSWKFDKTKRDWNPPIAEPDDGKNYMWEEEAYLKDNTKGWIEIK